MNLARRLSSLVTLASSAASAAVVTNAAFRIDAPRVGTLPAAEITNLVDSAALSAFGSATNYTDAAIAALSFPATPGQRVYFATCSTAAGTTAKVATTDGRDFALTNGAVAVVHFVNAGTAANPTLSIDGSAAARIYRYASTSAFSSSAPSWRAGEAVSFVYTTNGPAWRMTTPALATTANAGMVQLSSSTNSTSAVQAATPAAVRSVALAVGDLAAQMGAPSWQTNAVGANPAPIALSVSANTSYLFTGSGTLTFSAVGGLTSEPTYFIASGFETLSLPDSITPAGAGLWRKNRENHFVLWTTPTGTAVNYLFAQ